jgi:mannose-6-phosphate isomerase-like protein (cupin superfamily)
MAWTAGGHPLERKKHHGEKSITLLEFAAGFSDPKWCERSHVLYVIEGSLELEFDEGVAVLYEGECGVVDAGTRHRVRNAGDDVCRVFAVSDVDVGVR